MKWIINGLSRWLLKESQKRHAILLPLRIFIGLGWLRASIEKLLDTDWHSGSALNQFFFERIAEGDVAFPFYQLLIEEIFLAHAPLLSKLVILGELSCGIALLLGLFTRPALLAGIFMNLNFVLAGVVNPSVFYIIIQSILLPSAVGQVFGLDSHLLFVDPLTAIACKRRRLSRRAKMRLYLGGTLACCLLAIPIAGHVQTFAPTHSVEDPAMLLLILLALQSILLLILSGRAAQGSRYLRHDEAASALGEIGYDIILQHPIPEYVVQEPSSEWSEAEGLKTSAHPLALNMSRRLDLPKTAVQFIGYRSGYLRNTTDAMLSEPASRHSTNRVTF